MRHDRQSMHSPLERVQATMQLAYAADQFVVIEGVALAGCGQPRVRQTADQPRGNASARERRGSPRRHAKTQHEGFVFHVCD